MWTLFSCDIIYANIYSDWSKVDLFAFCPLQYSTQEQRDNIGLFAP